MIIVGVSDNEESYLDINSKQESRVILQSKNGMDDDHVSFLTLN